MTTMSLVCLKQWQNHSDKVLSYLSDSIVNRRLPRITIQNEEISLDYWQKTVHEVAKRFQMTSTEAEYLVVIGEAAQCGVPLE